jgi:hypothetical protein
MPGTHSQILLHVVFSTRGGAAFSISKSAEAGAKAYIETDRDTALRTQSPRSHRKPRLFPSPKRQRGVALRWVRLGLLFWKNRVAGSAAPDSWLCSGYFFSRVAPSSLQVTRPAMSRRGAQSGLWLEHEG